MKHRIPEAVLPSHGAGVGPFAPRGAPQTPAPAIVYLACFGCAVFLVLCVVSENGARETEPDVRDAGGGRRLTQWLAPVWYSLPTLFDSLYNLGEAWTNFQLLPEEYRLAAEANARAAMLLATEGSGAGAFAPEAAPENDAAAVAAVAADDAATERDQTAFDAYQPFPEYPDAVRMMRR